MTERIDPRVREVYGRLWRYVTPHKLMGLVAIIAMASTAIVETEVTGSPLPLAATARFVTAPRLERFVARNVAEAIDFIRTGAPPKR